MQSMLNCSFMVHYTDFQMCCFSSIIDSTEYNQPPGFGGSCQVSFRWCAVCVLCWTHGGVHSFPVSLLFLCMASCRATREALIVAKLSSVLPFCKEYLLTGCVIINASFIFCQGTRQTWYNSTLASRRKRLTAHFDDLEHCYFSNRMSRLTGKAFLLYFS